MKFTIVTPSYNQADYIAKTLSSVQRQTLNDYEHLIYDPGSKDGSQDIITKYCAGNPKAIAHFGKDHSQTHAVNLGFFAGTGEILCWINSDDFYANENVLDAVFRYFDSDPSLDVVYGRGNFISHDGKKLKEAFVHRDSGNLRALLANSLGILQPSLFIRKSSFIKAGALDEKMNFSFDYEYWARCISFGMKFKFVDLVISEATIHDSAKTIRARDVSLREASIVAKRYYDFLSVDWVKRIVDQEASGSDGITSSSAEIPEHLVSKRFIEENLNQRALTKFFNSDSSISDATSKAFRAWVVPTLTRVFVSAWDSNYFDMGITLIASLHRHDSESWTFVCDIGMSDDQREFVKALRNVVLLDRTFPQYAEDWQSKPKNYVFKNVLFTTLVSMLPEGSNILWIDAGVSLCKSPNRIFDLIAADGHFFVDHDDSRHWPLFNASFTSDAAITAAEFTWAEMAAPHVCTCLFGVRKGSGSEELFREAARLAAIKDVAVGDKHPPSDVKKMSSSKAVQSDKAVGLKGLKGPVDNLDYLRQIFGYFGHRQDQSILSALVARHGANISSAKTFCPANDASSVVSKENWFDGVSKRLGEFQRDDFNPGGVTFHHRGLIKDFSGLKFDFPQKNICAVLGNGPSLSRVDLAAFGNFDTVGMNAAYRYWETIDWYPTFYCCLDTVVGMSHKEAILELVRHRKRFGIRQFLVRKNLFDWLLEQSCVDGVISFDLIRKGYFELLPEPVTTGSHSLGWAAAVGYERFAIAGVDCNYVELVDGSKKAEDKTLEIVEEATNPNYFFAGYQKVGDKYNVPNFSKDLHIRSWRNVGGRLSENCVAINVSAVSRMDAFPKAPLDLSLSLLSVDGNISSAAASDVLAKMCEMNTRMAYLEIGLQKGQNGTISSDPASLSIPAAPIEPFAEPFAVQLELDQLRENFAALSRYAGALDKRIGGGLAAPLELAQGGDLIDRLKTAGGPSSARLLLTSLGSALLCKTSDTHHRIAQDDTLRTAIASALAALADDDAHKQQFLRVQHRFG